MLEGQKYIIPLVVVAGLIAGCSSSSDESKANDDRNEITSNGNDVLDLDVTHDFITSKLVGTWQSDCEPASFLLSATNPNTETPPFYRLRTYHILENGSIQSDVTTFTDDTCQTVYRPFPSLNMSPYEVITEGIGDTHNAFELIHREYSLAQFYLGDPVISADGYNAMSVDFTTSYQVDYSTFENDTMRTIATVSGDGNTLLLGDYTEAFFLNCLAVTGKEPARRNVGPYAEPVFYIDFTVTASTEGVPFLSMERLLNSLDENGNFIYDKTIKLRISDLVGFQRVGTATLNGTVYDINDIKAIEVSEEGSTVRLTNGGTETFDYDVLDNEMERTGSDPDDPITYRLESRFDFSLTYHALSNIPAQYIHHYDGVDYAFLPIDKLAVNFGGQYEIDLPGGERLNITEGSFYVAQENLDFPISCGRPVTLDLTRPLHRL